MCVQIHIDMRMKCPRQGYSTGMYLGVFVIEAVTEDLRGMRVQNLKVQRQKEDRPL
jgi:hypothetical protein